MGYAPPRGLKPHRVKPFKLSRDPELLEKLTGVVGLYVNPLEKGIVLNVDEKSQIQALDRPQSGLPRAISAIRGWSFTRSPLPVRVG